MIGSLGYAAKRSYGTTLIYRLDTRTFDMESIATNGVGLDIPSQSRVIPFLVRDNNNMSAPAIVIPANAGIQFFAKNIKLPIFAESSLDPGMRRDDKIANFGLT